MSWSAVHPPLKTFLEGVSGTGKVYAHWPRVYANTDQPEFKEAFCDDQDRLNFIVFRRFNAVGEKSADDDNLFSRTYSVELEAFFAFSTADCETVESEFDFQELLDQISVAAEQAMVRTLGGAALTFSVPEWRGIKLVKWYGSPPVLTVHQVAGSMQVEVVTASGVTPAETSVPSIPAGLTAKEYAIGEALLEYLRVRLADMDLATIDWARGVGPHPSYPANPRTACPRLLLRAYTTDITPVASQGHDFGMTFSLFYQRRQTPGQAHQEVLLREMKLVEEALLQRFNPGNTKGAGADFCRPTQMVIHDEQRHPRIDDPALRVSVGELVVQVASHDRY